MNKRRTYSVVGRNFTNMKKSLLAFPIIAALLAHSSCQAQVRMKVDNSTVNQLNIAEYMGKWYEIARYDHSFEKGMTHVSAEYSLMPNGKIQVINRGIKDGETKSIVGKAKQPSPTEYPGRLKVSFFLWFYSDYYIMELDKDYRYALIGSSSDKYLWILSRTPQMEETELNKLLKNIMLRGYDLSKLVFVEQ